MLDDLPEWFGLEDAKARYLAAAADLRLRGAGWAGEVVGFVWTKDHDAFTAEVYVMAVKRVWHREGVGMSLVEASIRSAVSRSLRVLIVKTVAASSLDPY